MATRKKTLKNWRLHANTCPSVSRVAGLQSAQKPSRIQPFPFSSENDARDCLSAYCVLRANLQADILVVCDVNSANLHTGRIPKLSLIFFHCPKGRCYRRVQRSVVFVLELLVNLRSALVGRDIVFGASLVLCLKGSRVLSLPIGEWCHPYNHRT